MAKPASDQTRRRFLTSMGLVATAGAGISAASQTAAQEGQMRHASFAPARHPEDAWFETGNVAHRVFIDSSTSEGGATALHYANNILLGHGEGYGGSDEDYSLVVCFRHQSTPFGYNDSVWDKYGHVLSGIMGLSDARTEQPFRHNPLNMDRADLANRGTTIDKIIGRGISFAICNRATRSFSGAIARASGGDAEAVYQELVASNIPDSRFVPAGVVAVTRSQEYGYSLLYAG